MVFVSIHLGLAHLRDIDAHVLDGHAEHPRNFTAKLFDVLAFLPDHDAGSRRENRDIGFFRRPLDVYLADRCILKFLLDEGANQVIRMNVIRKSMRIGVPGG
jgi:hypothetical protein